MQIAGLDLGRGGALCSGASQAALHVRRRFKAIIGNGGKSRFLNGREGVGRACIRAIATFQCPQ